ncbi:MAG: ATP-binding protein [bacterium]|nr:ATP-binding protein [bacterium]
MKIRLFLVMVILYILAAFGWWLYSLIDFTNKEHAYEISSIKYKSAHIKEELVNFLYKNENSEIGYFMTFESNKNEFTKLLNNLQKEQKCLVDLTINAGKNNFNDLLTISPNRSEFTKINKRYETKLRAFYSEAIVFTLAVILGVLWVFSRLESLLNLNRMQNNFLLSVTHELKTPLAAIKLSAQTLSQRKLNEAILPQVINQTVQNADRLNDLIDNVLLATKIDGKSYHYNFETINIVSVIEKAAHQILNPPYFNGSLNIENGTYFIKGDLISLNLVFSNIFQNAIKYAGENTNIDVKFAIDRKKLKIILSDNGPGVLDIEKSKIFSKFYRSGDENTRQTKGTGLGLFLVKQILIVHDAKITVEDNVPKGAKFIITIKTT